MKPRRIFWAWDFAVGLLSFVIVSLYLPRWVPNELAKDYYGVGISVLSLIFAVFLAALTVIITASDDEFVAFLEESGAYSAIVANFSFSLKLLFFALIYSLVFYTYAAARIANGVHHQTKWFLAFFCFFFSWSLLAAFISTDDAIKYRDYRQRFVQARQKSKGT